MKEVRFGIVGCGKIFNRHVEAIKLIEGAKLQAVSDTNEGLLQEVKQTYHVPEIYNSYENLLNDENVDMIVICTPSGLHHKMVVEALKHDKHVLCEKPLAMKVSEAKEMHELANTKNLYLFEVKQNRYSPAIQILHNAVTQGWLGKILLGNATVRWNRTEEYYKQADWFGTLSMDGGVILNQAIHHIDLLCWMMGKPTSTIGITRVLNHNIEAPDTALAIVEFENNKLGNLELTTCAAPQNIEGSITIMGDKGTIKVGGKSLDSFDIWQVEGHEKPEIPTPEFSNHALLYKDILALFSGEEIDTLINAEESLKSLLLAEAIFMSSASNCKILINHDSINCQKY